MAATAHDWAAYESKSFVYTKAIFSIAPNQRPMVRGMKSEQALFGARLKKALAAAGLDASPAELVKLMARYGGEPVEPQAISGWLNGKHKPRPASLRVLARVVGMEPHELEWGGKAASQVRDDPGTWVPGLTGLDTLAVNEFLALSSAHRKLVRELIAALRGSR